MKFFLILPKCLSLYEKFESAPSQFKVPACIVHFTHYVPGLVISNVNWNMSWLQNVNYHFSIWRAKKNNDSPFWGKLQWQYHLIVWEAYYRLACYIISLHYKAKMSVILWKAQLKIGYLHFCIFSTCARENAINN